MTTSVKKSPITQKIVFSKKMKLKIGLILLLAFMVIANVVTAWALPNISVECCEDFILDYIDKLILKFELNLNWIKSILTILLLHSDIIFIYTLIQFVFKKFDKKFLVVLFLIWFLKIFTDWSFYQHNKHDNLDLITYANYFITSQFNSRNSLFSLSIALQFLCFLHINQQNNHTIFKWMIIINLILCSITFLMIKIFFTFQIIFSFMIVHYLKYLID